MRKHGAILAVALVVAALLPAATPAVAATPADLDKDLRRLIKTLPGSYAVSVRELDGEKRTVSVRPHAQLEPASVSKLFIAYAVFRKIDRGELSYTSKVSSGLSVRACLRAMIEPSDNVCAVELRSKVTTKYLNRVLKHDGYNDTHFWYSGGRTKKTSTSDLVTLLTRLERRELLSEDSTTRFLDLMHGQIWRNAIPTGLPANVRQVSKSGTLGTPSGIVQTDAAIVYGPVSRYAIAVMGTRGATIHSITRISKLIYRALEGPSDAPLFTYFPHQMATTTKTALRSSPSFRAGIVRLVSTETPVRVLSANRTWYRVIVGGRVGWINNTALRLRNPGP
jgi:beta-lactamase class A